MKRKTLFGTSLRALRTYLGFSQEAVGAQGFVSTPGYIKMENGQRSGSEKFIGNLTDWLVRDRLLNTSRAKELRAELLAAKYLDSRSEFLHLCVNARLSQDGNLRNRIASLRELLAEAQRTPARRGRPAGR